MEKQNSSWFQQMLADGFYIPQAVQLLKTLQDKCPLCRKRVKKSLYTVMGQAGDRRLNFNAPFVNSQADLIGPYLVKGLGIHFPLKQI